MQRLILTFAVLMSVAGSARADRGDAEFLQGLRDKGLGDMAIAYLQALEESQAIPDELRTTFDLEFGRSLISDSESTPNVDRASQDLVRGRERLEKFLSEHGDHPEAGVAWRSVGEISLARGERLRNAAGKIAEAGRQQAEYAAARAEFVPARAAFEKAVALFAERMAGLRQPEPRVETAASRKNSRARDMAQALLDAATEQWLDGRYLIAQTDYLLGLCEPNLMNMARLDALNRASREFDDVFQLTRTSHIGIGLSAHYSQGKVLEALGDFRTALDIYQEVLARTPEPAARGAVDQLRPFAEAKRSELAMMRQLGKEDDAFNEAQDWLDRWQSAQRLPAYQAVVIDFAKMLEARAAKLESKDSERLITKASAKLSDIARLPGRYQTEAIRLRRDLAAKMGRTLEINSFADAVALGEGAAQVGDWTEAVTSFRKALDLSAEVRPQERIEAARMQLARSLLFAGDLDGAFQTADEMARRQPPGKFGPAAAVIALNAALNLAAAAPVPEKEAARKRLYEIADHIKVTWPRRAEADDAAIALGRLQLVDGNATGAVATFEALATASDRYGQAQLLAAQVQWRVLQQERREGQTDDAAFAARREAIIAQVQRSIARLETDASLAEPTSQTLSDARLLLAELYEDAGRNEEALALYEPLVEMVMQNPDAQLSPFTLRVATGAASAEISRGKIDRARAIVDFLQSRGGDVPVVNNVLINFAVVLQKQGTAAADAPSALGSLVEKLAERSQLSLRERIILGDLANETGRQDLARAQYEQALRTAESGTDVSPQAKAALIRVRAQLVGLLRQENKFDQALVEVNKLLEETPRSLEPNMERARILLALAEAEPGNSQKYGEAVAAWSRLRLAMARMPKKPPEYYEAILGAATSLGGQAKATSDAAAAREFRSQARQLLAATLALAPELSGPEMAQRYEALLGELGP